jgi:hypothetical protein
MISFTSLNSTTSTTSTTLFTHKFTRWNATVRNFPTESVRKVKRRDENEMQFVYLYWSIQIIYYNYSIYSEFHNKIELKMIATQFDAHDADQFVV